MLTFWQGMHDPPPSIVDVSATTPHLFHNPPRNSSFAGFLPDSKDNLRVEIAENPVKCAFRGVCPHQVHSDSTTTTTKRRARQIYRACFNVPTRNSRFTGLLLDSPIASAPRTLENDHRAVFAYLERIAHCLRHNLDRRFKSYAGIAVDCVSTPDATVAIAARIVVAKSFFIISRHSVSRGGTS